MCSIPSITQGWNFQHYLRDLDTHLSLKLHSWHFQETSRCACIDMGLLPHFWLACHLNIYQTLNLALYHTHHVGPLWQCCLLFVSESLAKRICICSLHLPWSLCFSTFFFFCLVCVIFNAVIFLPELLLCSHYFKLNHVWQRTVNTSVLKGFLSNWKPLLSTCYIAFYICLLHTTGLWGLSALMWNCPNTTSLSMENITGKAEESKAERQ